MKFKLTVIIPTLGQSPHLRGLLERLQRQHLGFQFEVLVVANIPQQQLRNLVNSMGANSEAHFEYLETGKLGVNLARNKGLERARGEILLFLDDDVILDNDGFLLAHVERHFEFDGAAAIGGPYVLTGSTSTWDRVYHDLTHEWLRDQTLEMPLTTRLLGGNVSLKKSLVDQHRWNFDENVLFGGAEASLFIQIVESNGILLFFESLGISHSPHLSMSQFFQKAYLQGAGTKWREKNSLIPHHSFVNLFRPGFTYIDTKLWRAKKLYQKFFDFGYFVAPYNDRMKRSAPPKLNYLLFSFFLVGRLRPFQRISALIRQTYLCSRSAWLNGARKLI